MGPEYSSLVNAENVPPGGDFRDRDPGQSLQWHSAPFPSTQCVLSGLMFSVAVVAGGAYLALRIPFPPTELLVPPTPR